MNSHDAICQMKQSKIVSAIRRYLFTRADGLTSLKGTARRTCAFSKHHARFMQSSQILETNRRGLLTLIAQRMARVALRNLRR